MNVVQQGKSSSCFRQWVLSGLSLLSALPRSEAFAQPLIGSETTLSNQAQVSSVEQRTFPVGTYLSFDASFEQRDAAIRSHANKELMLFIEPQEEYANVRKLFASLDLAAHLGVSICIKPFGKSGGSATDPSLATTLASFPAVKCFTLRDDCNNRSPAMGPGPWGTRLLHERLLPFGKTTYISCFQASSENGFRGAHEYAQSAEVLAIQSYPVDRPEEQQGKGSIPLREVFYKVREMVDAVPNNEVWANLQTFRWGEGRYPTARELDVMSWLAVVGGAKGIIYYRFSTEQNQSTLEAAEPKLWKKLLQLRKETLFLSPSLLEGAVSEAGISKNHHLFSRVWSHQGRLYVVAVNANEDPAAKAEKLRIPLPEETAGVVLPLRKNQPDAQLSKGALTLLMSPGVALYELPVRMTKDARQSVPPCPNGVFRGEYFKTVTFQKSYSTALSSSAHLTSSEHFPLQSARWCMQVPSGEKGKQKIRVTQQGGKGVIKVGGRKKVLTSDGQVVFRTKESEKIKASYSTLDDEKAAFTISLISKE